MVMSCASLKSPLFLIKVVELVMAVICTVLSSVHPTSIVYYEYFYKMEVVHGTFIGFSLVASVIILGYVTGNALKTPLIMIISATAAIMFLTSGIFVFQAHINYSSGVTGTGNLIAAGIFAIITCMLYLVDLGLTYKNAGVVAI
ncbi:uncharacterized protein [Anabrus simplex]|uniref:uncharacterized protein n=1 Tax=Anabrus simplex TaxID=316456 RepID=UPI0035A2768D